MSDLHDFEGDIRRVTPQTVMLKVPPSADHMALLRATVSSFAAREQFTIDQVDDLRMAVEEAAILLLRRNGGEHLTLTITARDAAMEIELHTVVDTSTPVVDRASFTWKILEALSDDVRSDTTGTRGTVVLTKRRPELGLRQGSA